MTTPSNLTTVESQALSALAVGGTIANLLSPGGATAAAVSDILTAAGDVVQFVNTTNAVLANFTSTVNDPIATAFSAGQPYGGTFITSPTVSSITPVNFDQSTAASTQALSQLSAAQQATLSAQTGVTLNTDADLTTALNVVFAQNAANAKQAFAADLTITSNIVVNPPASTTVAPVVVAIPPITTAPNMAKLSAFVSMMAPSFTNTPGIAGVIASVWQDNLGDSVGSNGTPVNGIPASINAGLYNDITTAAATPAPTTDYSAQQNQLNTVIALAIDNGLANTLAVVLASQPVTPVTQQVIKNRLPSVAQRGDTTMFTAMTTALGVNNTPNVVPLLTTLLQNLAPSDQVITEPVPVITASGITLTTTSNTATTAQVITQVQSLLSTLNVTITTLINQQTCTGELCSLPLINVSVLKTMNQKVVTALFDPITLQMAGMFN